MAHIIIRACMRDHVMMQARVYISNLWLRLKYFVLCLFPADKSYFDYSASYVDLRRLLISLLNH